MTWNDLELSGTIRDYMELCETIRFESERYGDTDQSGPSESNFYGIYFFYNVYFTCGTIRIDTERSSEHFF